MSSFSEVLWPLSATVMPTPGGAGGSQEGVPLLSYVAGGGVIGFIIIGLSVLAICLIVIHAIQIRRASLMPESQIVEIGKLLGAGKVNEALGYCTEPTHDSFLTRILEAGLTRYLRSPFGAFEIKQTLEEAGQEEAARLYRATDGLGIIGTVAPLLGLLGTVQGMIGAFQTAASSAVNDANYHDALAANISLALITTMMGLIVAIPCVTLFTVFRNRIDAIASEVGRELDRMVLLLEASGSQVPSPMGGPRAGAATLASGGPSEAPPVRDGGRS